jgi:hypothetical protein
VTSVLMSIMPRKTADKFNLRFEEIPGSNALILKMLSGPWDDDFMIVEPGKTVTYFDFKTSPEVIKSETQSQCEGTGYES